MKENELTEAWANSSVIGVGTGRGQKGRVSVIKRWCMVPAGGTRELHRQQRFDGSLAGSN